MQSLSKIVQTASFCSSPDLNLIFAPHWSPKLSRSVSLLEMLGFTHFAHKTWANQYSWPQTSNPSVTARDIKGSVLSSPLIISISALGSPHPTPPHSEAHRAPASPSYIQLFEQISTFTSQNLRTLCLQHSGFQNPFLTGLVTPAHPSAVLPNKAFSLTRSEVGCSFPWSYRACTLWPQTGGPDPVLYRLDPGLLLAYLIGRMGSSTQ